MVSKASSSAEAIERAVNFLKTRQARDGSFRTGAPNTAFDLGITGLVVKALANSPGGIREADKASVSKAAKFIVSHQRSDGGIRGSMLGTYTTSIAVISLKALNDSKYQSRIDRALRYLKEQQVSSENGYDPKKDKTFGGFGYGGSKDRADLSNTQMVLDAFEAAGLSKSDEAYKEVAVFLSRCQNNSETNDQAFAGTDGGGVYNPTESKAGAYAKPDGSKGLRSYGSMTYALFKSMIYANLAKDDPRVTAAMGWIRKNYTLDENPGIGQQGVYYYYHTFATALDAYGEDVITDDKGVQHDWRKELTDKLIALQKPDGSWENEQDRWQEGDPVLVTSYAILALEAAAKKPAK